MKNSLSTDHLHYFPEKDLFPNGFGVFCPFQPQKAHKTAGLFQFHCM